MGIRLVDFPAGVVFGYKALPSLELEEPAGIINDWQALYPQTSVLMAVNYLPNQWTRGHEQALIVELTPRRMLKVLVCDDPIMTRVDTSSRDKADFLRHQLRGLPCASPHGPDFSDDRPLMDLIGDRGMCLCILDAEDYELVVPHCLIGDFVLRPLFSCHVSEHQPMVTGRVEGVEIDKRTLSDPNLLGTYLQSLVPGGDGGHIRNQLGISGG